MISSSDIKNVQDVTTPFRTILSTESNTIFTNSGATGRVVFKLPSPKKGQKFAFLVIENFKIELTGASLSTAFMGDKLISKDVGDYLELVCFEDNKWSIFNHEGWFTQSSARYSDISGGAALEKNNEKLFRWGINTTGRMGDGTTSNRSSPTSVVGDFEFIQVASGSFHAAALDASGFAWGWGVNTLGSIGDGTRTHRSSPVSVVGGYQFKKISSGDEHTLALDLNNFAWSWGSGSGGIGTIGDNAATNRSSPVSVVGGHKFIDIAAGLSHSVAIDEDGFAWAWGQNNNYGQVGDETAANRSSPTSVVGGHQFAFVAAGDNLSAGIDVNGFLWTWGNNTDGELGDNTVTHRSSPVSVVGDRKFFSVDAGGNSFSAIDGDGNVWCWGLGNVGELGTGTATAEGEGESSPVSVVGWIKFAKVAMLDRTATGLSEGGQVYSWGQGNTGEIGDDAVASRSSPVSIVRLALGDAGVKIGKTRL